VDTKIIERWKENVAFERARKAAPAGFPTLPDIPGGRYWDPEFFTLEREALFKRCWLYAGHTDQLPTTGSFFVWRRTGTPILIMRGEDDRIRAFYNTCRHRGAPLVREQCGQAHRSLSCGYHGWTYDTRGNLKAVPDPRDWVGLDMSCRSLVSVRCERLGNWLFVCEDTDAPSLDSFLAPVSRYFRHLPLEDLRLVHQRTVEVAGNFKVVLENFLEAYHFRLLHRHTTDRIFDNLGTSIHLWEHGHSIMLSPNRRPDWIDPGTIGMPEMPTATTIERDHNPSYSIFPNIILPIAPTGIPSVFFWPQNVDRTLLDVVWFAPDWGQGKRDALWETRIANFDRIVDEDISFVEPIQESITSPGFRGVPLNYQERRIYHWHEELDRRIGVERIPQHLRVEPMLEAWIERDY
jgi:phenylpropionate dioxygenase-like ring-hydroxylating dioxygenase large terminal subunit